MLWGRHEAELLETYQAVDREIGAVLDQAADTTVIVMSDHGFAAFDRSVNLNTWLWREGFLQLDDPRNAGEGEMFAHVDWGRTKAYAMGLNALYINLSGREKNGIVHPGADRDAVLGELKSRLREFRDPETQQLVVSDLSTVGETTSRFAPDLIVGYTPGYRGSWETALGVVPSLVIRDNTDAWIADHCIAAASVPGVLLGNRTPRVANPQLKDIPVTILKEFGIEPGPEMTGRPVY